MTRKLYEDFGVLDDDRYIVPFDLSELTVGWFFNHSDKPNIGCRSFYRYGFDFYALRKIKVSEELTLDYSAYEVLYLQMHHQSIETGRKSPRVKG